ncbi:hypothetical protein [Marinicrinis lubricantis]|uniref:YgiT-type zinc finger domain-containing protein n=1 Tax=Marinicrinis lubricantis TaxID=2086470 RepID=A0ABW1IQJ8_9BACL
MDIYMRTVLFSDHLEIKGVPVYCCDECGRNEVLPGVKDHLKEMIQSSSKSAGKVSIDFSEQNEVALLLSRAADEDYGNVSLEVIIDERINQLLDMLIMAQNLHNDEWIEDIQDRLSQISNYALSTYDFT